MSFWSVNVLRLRSTSRHTIMGSKSFRAPTDFLCIRMYGIYLAGRYSRDERNTRWYRWCKRWIFSVRNPKSEVVCPPSPKPGPSQRTWSNQKRTRGNHSGSVGSVSPRNVRIKDIGGTYFWFRRDDVYVIIKKWILLLFLNLFFI